MEKIKSIIYELHNRYNFHKIFIFILFLTNIIYFYYLLTIGYYNVILVDDYCFMSKYNQYGVLGSVSWWYQNWQGRFSPEFFTNIILKSYELTHTLLPYTIILTSFFIYAILRLVRQLLPSPTMDIVYYPFLVFNISALLFNIFLIINFEFSTFFWVNVSTMYFGGLAFALLAISELISNSKRMYSYFIICLGFTYAGSSAEHFGAICVLLLACCIILVCWKYKLQVKDVFSYLHLNKVFLAFVVCSISFLLMIMAPGNEIRRAYFPKITFTEASLIALKSLFYLLINVFTEKAKYLLILSFPFIYLGTLMRNKESTDELKAVLIISGSLPIFVLFIYICMIPSAYAISSIGPSRGLTHIAFYLVLYTALLSFIIGYKTRFPKIFALMISVFCCSIIMLVTRDRIKNNLPETIKYAKTEKKRILKLLELKANRNQEPVILDSLYKSPKNILWYNEIAKDSGDVNNYWINQCISDGLELGFEVKLKSR